MLAITEHKSTSSRSRPSLSGRQRDILALLAEGKSNKEIADELAIGYGTVKQHLFVLFRKLNVTNRAKAVLVATQLMKGMSPEDLAKDAKKSKGRNVDGAQYVWRLVTAVSVFVPDTSLSSPGEIALRDQYLSALKEEAVNLVDALDGKFLSLPYGGMLAWFGHPVAHLDDADRAVFLAQHLQNWSKDFYQKHPDPSEQSLQKFVGIGVASHPEVVADKAPELFGADAFRMAAMLARYSSGVGRPFADGLTQKLAPLCVPWLAVKSNNQDLLAQKVRLGKVAAIGSDELSLPEVAKRFGGLPFLAPIFQTVNDGVAQWLSVESWPPNSATLLIDVIGNLAKSRGYQTLRLRTPSQNRRDRFLTSFSIQSETGLDEEFRIEDSASTSGGERLAAILAAHSQRQPLVIQLYGLKALEAFKLVLGDRGIDRLASRQILIVAANLQETGTPQTSVRLLGPRPVQMPFSRVFTLAMPVIDAFPEGIRVDLRAMLDSLSDPSRAFVMKYAQNSEVEIEEVFTVLAMPHHQSQACLQELTAIGLLNTKTGGGFEFRDRSTLEAIQRLSVSLAAG